MRTTVTLDDDVVAAVKSVARERGISFKAALNAALRAGLRPAGAGGRRYRMPTRNLGLRPGTDLTKALQLAAAMEDEGHLHDLERRK